MDRMIRGPAVTGAKFTPRNHQPSRDPVIDAAASGMTIKHRLTDVTDDAVIISFGASRNGPEVKEAIRHLGEWERVSQAALPLHMGGAHFVTTQAAVELQVIIDLERQHGPLNCDFACSDEFSELAKRYVPTQKEVNASLVAFSTANGANYGSTSPATQLAVLSRGISERNRLYLPHEIEWVQLERSYLATRFCIERPDIALVQRIVHYACQPDAQVDITRSGMEDTPYHYDVATGLALAGNVQLLIDVTTEMRKYGYEAVTEKNDVNKGLHFDVLKDRYTADMDSLSTTIEQLDQPCLL